MKIQKIGFVVTPAVWLFVFGLLTAGCLSADIPVPGWRLRLARGISGIFGRRRQLRPD
jgi:hypothetical protein